MQLIGSQGSISTVSVGATATAITTVDNRKYVIIQNDSGSDVFIGLTQTSGDLSTSVYTVKLATASTYEVPGIYVGPIYAIVSSGTANVNVTVIS